MGKIAVRPFLGKSDPSTRSVALALFALIVVVEHVFYECRGVVGHPPIRVAAFSWIATPVIVLFGYLLMVRFLPRVVFIGIVLFDFIATIALIEFRDYFRENFNIHILFNNSSEAGAVSGTFFALIPWYSMAFLVFTLVGKILLTSRIPPPAINRALRSAALVTLPVWALAVIKAPPTNASNVLYYDNTVRIHGLYPAVVYDIVFSPKTPTPEDIARRFAEIQHREPYKPVSLELDPDERFDNILAIQWESLDYNVIGRELGGKLIAPFASALRYSSLFFKLRAFHTAASGTSATDFMFLMGKKPFREYPTYRVDGIDFGDGLPNYLKHYGFESYVVHGLDLTFWGRFSPYRKMGFPEDHMVTIDSFQAVDTRWAVSDELVVNRISEILPVISSPHFVFWITITSHVPFDYVSNPVFSLNDGIVGDYFNAINYADKQIERLVMKGTVGRTLVLIWGDHSAELTGQSYQSRENGDEFIPGYIFFVENGELQTPRFSGSNADFLGGDYDFRSLNHFVRYVTPEHGRFAAPAHALLPAVNE